MSLTADLIEYWKLDEASGTRAASVSGTYDLTDNNTVGQASALASNLTNSADFVDTNSEYLSLAAATAVDFWTADASFTWRCWLNVRDFGSVPMGVLSHWAGNQGALLYVNASGSLRFIASRSGTNRLAAKTISAATTYMVACGWDATAEEVWIDLDAADSKTTASTTASWGAGNGPTVPSSTDWEIGRYLVGSYFDGQVDGVGIWSTDYSAADNSSFYASGNGLEYPFGAGGDPEDGLVRGKLIRGGLLLGGRMIG